MKNIKVNGIVIAEKNLNDFDKMVTLLTPNLGKIECSARGAKRSKSQLLSGTQFLCFGEYLLFKGSQDIYTINSCETIELFYNIRTDLEKLNYASHITKIVSDVTTENQNSYNVLMLFLNTLYAMSEKEKNLDFLVSVFKMRLMKYIGFMPRINKCTECNTKLDLEYFSIKDNGFKCKCCGKIDTSAIKISTATRKAIEYSLEAESKKIFSFELSNRAIEEFKTVSSIYLNQKLEKEYKIEKY